jgi:hypothetical protein
VGKTLVITWLSTRSFDNTAGNYQNSETLNGTMTLPKGWAITRFDVTTDWVGEKDTNAKVDLGAFAGGMFNKTGKSGVFNVAAGSDNVSQDGTIAFTVGAANQTLIITWPTSADSIVQSVPEPSSMVLFGLGLVALCGAAKKGIVAKLSAGQAIRRSVTRQAF